ncbi:MAG TPA: hypothetical protein VNA25_25920 [Phycisphaerae bacterium]|nr:hypothetical protein [Phycisphaerae bacterium]
MTPEEMAEMTPKKMAAAGREIIGWDGDTIITVEKIERVANLIWPISPTVDRGTVPEILEWKIEVKNREGKDLYGCIEGCDLNFLLALLRLRRKHWKTQEGVTT